MQFPIRILCGPTLIVFAWITCVSPIEAGVVELDSHRFTLPDGFTIERVTDPLHVPRPVSASVDDRGRLFVTDSSGSNLPPAEQLKAPDHRILLLEDSTGDGFYDKTTVFAEEVMFPQGCLWHDGWVYVAAPPDIWRFRDTNGDGRADEREIWWKGGTLTGCANDVHGPHLGPDGWLYWTKGAFASQRHERENRPAIEDRAAHIYRARPDGSGLEIVMSGGMDNPVEITFTPEGDVLFTSTFIDFTQPGRRDGLAHAITGGVFGKPNDVVEDRRITRTLPTLLQPFVQFGAGAPSGVHRYEHSALGQEFENNVFATLFNLRKVTRHVLKKEGATFGSTDSDFVVSDNFDFHPTDVLEDVDGSLLVVDTGGWYKLCCPSSQLAKSDVLGAIYRVRPISTSSGSYAEARRSKMNAATIPLSIDAIVSQLGGEDTLTRAKATRLLVSAGSSAVAPLQARLQASTDPAHRRTLLWTLHAIGTLEAQSVIRNALWDTDSGIATIAARSIALSADSAARNSLMARTLAPSTSQDLHLLRALLDALHVVGIPADAPSLIRLADSLRDVGMDRSLQHALTWALIGLGDESSLREALDSAHGEGGGRQMVFMALDSLGDGVLEANEVFAELTSANIGMRDVAEYLVRRHPEWSQPLAEWLQQRLAESAFIDGVGSELSLRLLRLVANSDAGNALLTELVSDADTPPPVLEAALAAMRHSAGTQPPAAWSDALGAVLNRSIPSALPAPAPDAPVPFQNASVLNLVLQTAESVPLPDSTRDTLLALGRNPLLSSDLRWKALLAVVGLPSKPQLPDDLFNLAIDNLKPESSPPIRRDVARCLQRARLTSKQRVSLARALPQISPIEQTLMLSLLEQSADAALGPALLDSMKSLLASGRNLNADVLRRTFRLQPESMRQQAEMWIQQQELEPIGHAERLEELLKELSGLSGDIRRGQAVFLSDRTACFTCHRMGYQGGDFGPDLTTIGQVRSTRDLLESILFPDASFVRSYEPTVVTTRDGESIGGILKSRTDTRVVLATGPGAERMFAGDDVVDIQSGTTSAMPGGLDTQLSRQELADLLTFLQNTRWGAK